MAAILLQQVARLPFGAADYRAGADKNPHWPGCGAGTQIVDDAANVGVGAAVDEHTFGMERGERPAAIGGARLIEYRRALWRWLPQRDGVDAELLAPVADTAHPRGIGVKMVLAIADHRVVAPAALPQCIDHLHVFV